MTGLKMKYFVLKPRGDGIYAKASRRALRSYAVTIRDENPELSDELQNWASDETSLAVGMATMDDIDAKARGES